MNFKMSWLDLKGRTKKGYEYINNSNNIINV